MNPNETWIAARIVSGCCRFRYFGVILLIRPMPEVGCPKCGGMSVPKKVKRLTKTDQEYLDTYG